jgi:hypothetical protein
MSDRIQTKIDPNKGLVWNFSHWPLINHFMPICDSYRPILYLPIPACAYSRLSELVPTRMHPLSTRATRAWKCRCIICDAAWWHCMVAATLLGGGGLHGSGDAATLLATLQPGWWFSVFFCEIAKENKTLAHSSWPGWTATWSTCKGPIRRGPTRIGSKKISFGPL